MIFLNKTIYEETLALKEGREEPSLLLLELQALAKKIMGIHVANFTYGRIPGGTNKRLFLILDGDNDSEKVQTKWSAANQEEYILKDCFEQLCEQYGHPNWCHGDRFFVSYCDFLEEMSTEVVQLASRELLELPVKYPNLPIWKVYLEFSKIHIFYENAKQVEVFENDGTSDKLASYCRDIVEKYDTYGIFHNNPLCTFVSHQLLIEQYKDNMFYYTRR